MESAATTEASTNDHEVERTQLPPEQLHLRGKGRVIAIAKLREFADKLERHELDGVSLQWRERHEEEVQQGRPSEMVTVTVTPHTAEVGTVQLLTYTIEEE